MNILITGASGGIGKQVLKSLDNKSNNFCLFGYKNIGERYSGPFGDETIAGSFLKNFGFISNRNYIK